MSSQDRMKTRLYSGDLRCLAANVRTPAPHGVSVQLLPIFLNLFLNPKGVVEVTTSGET